MLAQKLGTAVKFNIARPRHPHEIFSQQKTPVPAVQHIEEPILVGVQQGLTPVNWLRGAIRFCSSSGLDFLGGISTCPSASRHQRRRDWRILTQ
jgi:hypothetical protein